MTIQFQFYNKSYWGDQPWLEKDWFNKQLYSVDSAVEIFWECAFIYSPNLAGISYTPRVFSDGTYSGVWEDEKKRLIGLVIQK